MVVKQRHQQRVLDCLSVITKYIDGQHTIAASAKPIQFPEVPSMKSFHRFWRSIASASSFRKRHSVFGGICG
jgi:hypothetical protein